jgi:hypothetical protein
MRRDPEDEEGRALEDYGSGGWGFESLTARAKSSSCAHTALACPLDAGRAIWSGGAGLAGWPARPPAAPPRPGSSR